MPSKCIADKELKNADGEEFIGFQIFNGPHRQQYVQGEVYPSDELAKVWRHDFEFIEAEPPESKSPPKKKLKEQGGEVYWPA